MEIERGFAIRITRGVIVAERTDKIIDVAKLMAANNIGAVLIVANEKLVGIVSERDVVTRVVANNLDPTTTSVQNIMTKRVITGDLKDGLDKIYKALCQASFRHLPIVDKGKLVGIVSKRDILYSLRPRR